MPMPDENVVRRVLSQNERDVRIRACIEKAWKDFAEKYTERANWRRKSTTRGLMWENSVESVVSEFDDEVGIVSISHKDTVSFIADDTVLFRLKKSSIKSIYFELPDSSCELVSFSRT